MDDLTLQKLEFDTIRREVAGYAGGALGRELALRMHPTRSIGMVKRWLGQVSELIRVAESKGMPPLGSVRDIRPHVRASSTPAGLDAEKLSDIAATLSATGLLTEWSANLPEDAPLLVSLMSRVGDFTSVARKINESIDERGRVRDEASPKLTTIRATISKAKENLRKVFERLVRAPSATKYLQYANATFHNDRRVLPLKAEHRGRIPGIIHRSSDSGGTLFVEPSEAVELNNSIVRLGHDEHKEISRIVGELSRTVHVNEEGILATLDAIAILDLLVAKARFAEAYDARVPEVNEKRTLNLRGARHPVLEILVRKGPSGNGRPERVVPIDVRLGDDFDVLIITGPNTGGKTVAIKTVGLLALMTQSGIPIPVADGTCLPIYNHVLVDIGDEQSIEQSLSTFSSHLQNHLAILQRAGPSSLVLIDELGAGTDPDEGAAIGRAITDELLLLGTSAVITTHLSMLKAVAFSESRVDNASVEFDPATCKPTFRLRLGEPGNSNALTIARRLGMSKRMVQRAKAHINHRHQALNNAIKGTLDSRRKAEKARAEAEKAKLEAKKRHEEMEIKTAELAKAREDHDRWVAWINALRAGDEVHLRRLNRSGKVVRMQWQKQSALVVAGAVDIEVGLRELCPPGNYDS